jgi:hypothetical protein
MTTEEPSISFSCPHCGQPFGLTRGYVAAYGGHSTQCTSCNADFAVPHISDVVFSERSSSVSSVQDQTIAPTSSDETDGIWREDDHAVVVGIPKLPQRCIKCNCELVGRPVTFKAIKSTYRHIRTGVAEVSLVVSAISANLNRSTVRIKGHICARHWVMQKLVFLAGVLAALCGLAVLALAFRYFISPGQHHPVFVVAYFSAGLGISILGAMFAKSKLRTLRILHVDLYASRIGGFGQPFLDSLTDVRASRAAHL